MLFPQKQALICERVISAVSRSQVRKICVIEVPGRHLFLSDF
jgi:hypothetical protein